MARVGNWLIMETRAARAKNVSRDTVLTHGPGNTGGAHQRMERGARVTTAITTTTAKAADVIATMAGGLGFARTGRIGRGVTTELANDDSPLPS